MAVGRRERDRQKAGVSKKIKFAQEQSKCLFLAERKILLAFA